jgi:hypothetical protein
MTVFKCPVLQVQSFCYKINKYIISPMFNVNFNLIRNQKRIFFFFFIIIIIMILLLQIIEFAKCILQNNKREIN